jgi:uncharacterized phage protein gp47/JayE
MDRLTALCEQTTRVFTGIDFVQVVDPAVQTVLRVFFHIDPDQLQAPLIQFPPANPGDVDFPPGSVSIVSISGGESLAEAEVIRATWTQAAVAGQLRVFLEVEVAEPGDFSIYRLTIDSDRIDRFFNGVEFSFKQGCPSPLDCKPREGECPPPDLVDFPIDYLARDYTSLRSALLDFAAQRYPNWAEVVEADGGVMLAEVMAALGDEFSYIQDRFAREAYLPTATQRRSLRWHTSLVDYAIHDGLSATTVLAIRAQVNGAFVPAGTRTWAALEGGTSVPFEIGEGLRDVRRFWVHSGWNSIQAHNPDESKPCLPIGATEIFLHGHFPNAQLPNPALVGENDDNGEWVGRLLLLESNPVDPSLPARRHLVRITAFEQGDDPLQLESGSPTPYTRVAWDASEATPFELPLAVTTACVNIVPATAGETHVEYFAIGSKPANAATEVAQVAVEREGPCNELTGERPLLYLYSLIQSEARGLGWRGELRKAQPEIELLEVEPDTLDPIVPTREWSFLPSLLEATSQDRAFTLEHGTWRTIFEVERFGRIFSHPDYATQNGFTVRYGDGEFGVPPAAQTVFRARYRTDAGTKANLPADTVTTLVDPAGLSTAPTLSGVAESVGNPFAITTGVDPEDSAVIRQLAPEAFKAETFRAVRDEDYRSQAEKVPGVQRAGARARWTGSWLTEFVAIDPLNAFSLSDELRAAVENLLDGVRQVGREVYVNDPVYVNLDLIINICVEPTAYAGQVVERVITALTVQQAGLYADRPFFHPDNFTFGTPLYRAALEAAVQNVPGVRAVTTIEVQARGITEMREFVETVFEVSDRQILRLQNDPRLPERGSLRVYAGG